MEGSIIAFLEESKTRAVKTGRNLEKAQKIFAVSDVQQRMLTDKASSATKALSSGRVEHTNVRSDIDQTAVLVLGMKVDVGKSLLIVFTEAEMQYENMVEAVYMKLKESLAERWRKWKLTTKLRLLF